MDPPQCYCKSELDKNHIDATDGKASRNELSYVAHILPFVSNICQQVDEKKKTKSELKVKYTYNVSLLFKCFVFPLTLLCYGICLCCFDY